MDSPYEIDDDDRSNDYESTTDRRAASIHERGRPTGFAPHAVNQPTDGLWVRVATA